MVPYIMTEDTITVILDGEPHTILADNKYWDDVIDALKSNDKDKMLAAVDRARLAAQLLEGCVVKDGAVLYNGEQIHGRIVDMILSMHEKGISTKSLQNFIENMMENPSKDSIDDLYRFIEHSKMPITDDGCFLAYKKITDDYKDVYTRTIDNSIGAVVEMNREEVDANRHRTCSTGLHFAAYSYMKEYQGDRIVIVKVNPRDVVSIPVDYDNAKGRCCKYEVVGELADKQEDVLTNKDHISEVQEADGVEFTEDVRSDETPLEAESKRKNWKPEIFKLIDRGVKLLETDEKTGKIKPTVKYVMLDKGKYLVERRLNGTRYRLGRFNELNDAEMMAYKMAEAEFNGKLKEFLEENAVTKTV